MSDQTETQLNDPEKIEATAPDRITLRLTKPHPLITRTLQEEKLRKKPDYSYARQVQTVDFRASKKQTRTALAILDRLFKALEAQDFEIVLGNTPYSRGGTFAQKGRDQCPITIDEVHENVAHEITSNDKANQESYGRAPPKWDSIPTGQFTLSHGGKVDLWTEEAFAASLARTVAAITEHIELARKKREEREHYEREEAHRQHLKYEEEQRIKTFRESAQSLENYRMLMSYIEEVRRHGVIPTNQRRQNQTLEEWLSWAEELARRFHPLA